MVRKAISELTEKTTTEANDLLVLVDSATSPNETKKVKYSNLDVTGLSGLLADRQTAKETGRTATYTIAASDAPAHVKAQADYVCTGTDDQDVIQPVIDLLIAAGGGVLEFTEGTFNVQIYDALIDDVCLEFTSATNLLIKGQGISTKIITTDGADIFSFHEASNVTIRDIYLKGSGVYAVTRNGIDFDDSTYCQVENITLEDTSDNSIIFHGNGADGARVSYGHSVTNCIIINSKVAGIVLYNTYDSIVKDNKIFTPATAGIISMSITYLTPHAYKNIIKDNIIYDPTGSGINVAYSQWSIVKDNQIYSPGSAGIVADKGADNTEIEGNLINGTVSEAVICEGNDIKVVANTIIDVAAGVKGIRCYPNYNGYLVMGNYVKGSQDCIAAYGPIVGLRIIANRVENAARYGIFAYDVEKAIIASNTITAAVTQAISYTKASCMVSGNDGYIARGEIRTYSGLSNLTTTQNAYNSVDNPFGQAVRVANLHIYVSTAATATSPNIDCGIGSSATTDYTTLFDDLPGETVGFYTSTITTPGAQTVPQLWASGSGNRYLNMSIKDAAATGMVATYTVTVMGN